MENDESNDAITKIQINKVAKSSAEIKPKTKHVMSENISKKVLDFVMIIPILSCLAYKISIHIFLPK